MPVRLVGAPVGAGAGFGGAEAGARALRAAGLRQAIADTGRSVVDNGDVSVCPFQEFTTTHEFTTKDASVNPNPALKALPEIVAWTGAIRNALLDLPQDCIPVILGGDHSVSLGSIPSLAERARRFGRPFFVLWIDAHPDCHTLMTTRSGHLHGTPLAYALGAVGFEPSLPAVAAPLVPRNVRMLGIRDVEVAEAALMTAYGLVAHSPDSLRFAGPAMALQPWLDHIRTVNGMLHVSLDADALDPAVAPGVGTPVPGGLGLADIRTILAMAAATGQVAGLDLVEVNPFLDRGGMTASVMVMLAAELLRPAAVAAAQQSGEA